MRMTALVAAALLLPSVLLAQDAAKVAEKFVSLFDGKTLDGWKVENCKVEIQDGCIFLKAWKIDNLHPATGLIGLQCEVPGGGQFLVRNLRISER